MRREIKKQTGFSILEVTIAMGIIMVGLLGISTLVVQNIQAQSVNKNYLIASMLAQEGLELVRNTRDTNWFIYNRLWKYGLTDNATYDFNYNNTSPYFNIIVINNINDSGARLYLDGNGFYTHTSVGNTATPFSRIITAADNGNWAEFTATVHWVSQGKTYEYKATTYLYDWR